MVDKQLHIETNLTDKVAVIKLRGRVDLDTSPQLRAAFIPLWKNVGQAVIVNLEAAEYVDTSGLATFIECAQNLKAKNGRFLLCAPNDQVRGRIELAQLEGYFPVYETLDDAKAALNK
jgi:anti-sigma B factor antagonist